MPGKILVMRHADVYDSPRGERVLYGNADGYWLSHLGIRQAMASGHYIASQCELDYIAHSPLERTEQTARLVVDHNPANPRFEAVPDIRDIGVDPWAGNLLRTEWTDNRQKYWEMQMSGEVPGLEHPEEIQKRVVRAFNRIIEEHRDENILLVSHGDPICFLLQHLLHEPLEPLVNYHMGVNKAAVFQVQLEPEVAVRKLFEPREYGTVYPRSKREELAAESAT